MASIFRKKGPKRVTNPEWYLYQRTRYRALRLGVDFTLQPEDFVIPKKCPVLGFPIQVRAKDKDRSVSVDRIDSRFGYVSGNVLICSWRANRLKGAAETWELRRIADFYEKMGTGRMISSVEEQAFKSRKKVRVDFSK